MHHKGVFGGGDSFLGTLKEEWWMYNFKAI